MVIFEFQRFCENLKNGSIDFFETLNTRAWRCDQFLYWALLTLIYWNTFRFNVKEDVWTDGKACVTISQLASKGRGRVQRHFIIYRDHSRTWLMLETKINPISYDQHRSRMVDISLTYQTAGNCFVCLQFEWVTSCYAYFFFLLLLCRRISISSISSF